MSSSFPQNDDPNKCPICGELAQGSCRCPRGDSSCKNGHEWHTCTIHKKIVLGPSDHSTDTFSCTCLKEEEEKQKTEELCKTCGYPRWGCGCISFNAPRPNWGYSR